MKTLAVIRNELFKDYLQIVSTDNLEATLDNPNVPIPFTCVEAISNKNSDELREQLATYFNQAKLKNKEFFNLDETQLPQLTFMLNLIKLSSGEVQTESSLINKPTNQPIEENHTVANPITTENTVVENTQETQNLDKKSIQELTLEHNVDKTEDNILVEDPVETIAIKLVEPTLHDEEAFDNLDDPFGYKKVVTHKQPEDTTTQDEKVPSIIESDELIEELGIPQNATIHFYKNDSVTAQLLDEKTVIFDGETMTLIEATKAAFKKIGSLGMAAGLPNWIYKEKTLKQWKEQK